MCPVHKNLSIEPLPAAQHDNLDPTWRSSTTSTDRRLEQVLRYSALAFGVFYGFSHQRTISGAEKAAHAKKEYEHKQQLIEQARAKFAEQKNPKPASTEQSGRMLKPQIPSSAVRPGPENGRDNRI